MTDDEMGRPRAQRISAPRGRVPCQQRHPHLHPPRDKVPRQRKDRLSSLPPSREGEDDSDGGLSEASMDTSARGMHSSSKSAKQCGH